MAWDRGELARGNESEGGKGRLGPLDLGDRHRTVEGDHRTWSHGEELVVERQDLAPAGAGGLRRGAVNGLDGGLDLVGPRLVAPQADADDGLALGDEVPIPQAAVLVGQQN